jgi:hypothetical protein
MANEHKTTITGCVTMLAELFGKTASPALFRAYELGLSGLSAEQIKSASQAALESCRFMPPPAELRQLVYGKPEDRAVKAWMAFENAVVRNGYIKSVTFDDPVINATVRALGGWEHCCVMPAAEFDTFLQKRFQDTYCSLCRTGVPDDLAEPLIGLFDRQNAANKFPQSKPIEIATGLPRLNVRGIGSSVKNLEQTA